MGRGQDEMEQGGMERGWALTCTGMVRGRARGLHQLHGPTPPPKLATGKMDSLGGEKELLRAMLAQDGCCGRTSIPALVWNLLNWFTTRTGRWVRTVMAPAE